LKLQHFRTDSVYVLLPAIILLAGSFYRLSHYSYLLYNTLIDFLGSLTAIAIFAFGWGTRKSSGKNEITMPNEKITQNEKKFRDLVEQTTDWVWEVNLEGVLTYTNPRVTELTGYDLHEVIGKVPFDFMDPNEENIDKKYYYEAVTHRKPFYQLESTMLHKHGYPVVFETSGAPIINEHGELTGYRGIGRDITVRKEAEKALRQSQDEAQDVIEQANRAKSIFLANMSHEIRTPMNVIIGMADILYNSELNTNQKECAGMVRESATSLLTIINDILDFSKIEAGMLEMAQVHFHLHQEVEKTVSSLTQQAEKKGLKLSCSIDDNVPETVTGDPTRLQQVLVNLIGNAIKFTEQGTVAISIRRDKTGVLFSISDTGIGFPLDKMDWLFQSFTQADTSGTRKYEGTGLGLAISKNLVELMGGSIGVESMENQGSTFYFTIPFAMPTGMGDITETIVFAKPGENLPELPYEKKVLEILLVEDKPMNQKLATILLEKKGHKITTAKWQRKRWRNLGHNFFDLILMDIHMPEMDGLEATACIRACEDEAVRRIPIIAMTAYAMKEDRDKCLQAGMDYYIPKPINPGELYYALGKVMEGRV
jgi:PAS domain S-box-containing protein